MLPLTAVPIAGRRTALVTAGLVVAAIVTAILVVPGIHTTGAMREQAALKLGTSAAPGAQPTQGGVQENQYGFLVKPNRTARVTIPLNLPRDAGARTLLRLWSYGSSSSAVRTTISVVAADGARRSLGHAATWEGSTFDVTGLARHGDVSLRVTSVNRLNGPVQFLDGVAPVVAPDSGVATASTWSVALLVALVAAALLAVVDRLRRHWPLPLALAALAALVWHRIPAASLTQLPLGSMATWNDATSASWVGFHDGLLWGSWLGVSPLTVQLYHTFTPIVGDATVSARSAGLLAALFALAAVYALGQRAAGRAGAVAATLVVIVATPLRDAAFDASAVPVLVLAGALLAYGLHACVGRGTPLAVALAAAGLSLAALGEPLWLPGAVVGLVAIVLACGERGVRWRALGAGAVVMVVLVGPYLTSTASQNDGRPFAAIDAAAGAARNAEFTDGSHGAPSAAQLRRDPSAAGSSVSLAGYAFDEHSFSQVIGSTLSGGQKALSAFSHGDALNAIAFAVGLLGAAYMLILPRLRTLVLLGILIVLPTLFLAGRIDTDDFAAGALWWPVLPLGAAILSYAAIQFARPSLAPRLAVARARARRDVEARHA